MGGPPVREANRMIAKSIKPNQKLQVWIDARKRHHLSDAHIQMARELGLNPAKLGKVDNHRQEPWKAPLPQFIERLYLQRFGKTAPEEVISIEEGFRRKQLKKEVRRIAKQQKAAETT